MGCTTPRRATSQWAGFNRRVSWTDISHKDPALASTSSSTLNVPARAIPILTLPSKPFSVLSDDVAFIKRAHLCTPSRPALFEEDRLVNHSAVYVLYKHGCIHQLFLQLATRIWPHPPSFSCHPPSDKMDFSQCTQTA